MSQFTNPEAQQAIEDLSQGIREFCEAWQSFAKTIVERVLPAIVAFAEASYPFIQELAIRHEIEAGWTHDASAFRIHHVFDRNEVIDLAQKYIEEHKDDYNEEE